MAAIKVGVGEDEYNTFCSEFKSAQDSFVKQIEQLQNSENETIDSFVQAIDNIDTCC